MRVYSNVQQKYRFALSISHVVGNITSTISVLYSTQYTAISYGLINGAKSMTRTPLRKLFAFCVTYQQTLKFN